MATKGSSSKLHDVIIEDIEFGQAGDVPLLARLYRRFSALPETAEIRHLFDAQVTAENVETEVAYLQQPMRGGFERPYGWAWLLMLAAELKQHASADGKRWSATLQPLAYAIAERFRAFLPKATYPVRSGTHASPPSSRCSAKNKFNELACFGQGTARSHVVFYRCSVQRDERDRCRYRTKGYHDIRHV